MPARTAIDPNTKRRYNLTYKLRKQGFEVNSKLRTIPIYIRQFKAIVNNSAAISLVKEYDFELVQNKQLELFN